MRKSKRQIHYAKRVMDEGNGSTHMLVYGMSVLDVPKLKWIVEEGVMR